MAVVIRTNEYPIYLGKDALEELEAYFKINAFSQYFVLMDENTKSNCWPLLKKEVPFLGEAHIIEIESGEVNKVLDTCSTLWQFLTDKGADRNSILINLGGGVITDMGGFVAKTFKRGMYFINIPTTLLAQADASIGGKLAVDFMSYKNQIGLFGYPNVIIVNPDFLNTLDKRELRSGFAEVIKHGLIQDKNYWNSIQEWSNLDDVEWNFTISKSIKLKKKIVDLDPFENGLRKSLNFGHTLGHAIETFYLGSGQHLLHGEAISVGMIMEAYLSYKRGHLTKEELDVIQDYIFQFFEHYDLSSLDIDVLKKHLLQDKKNKNKNISFTLLKGIGDVLVDQFFEEEDILDAIEYYRNLEV